MGAFGNSTSPEIRIASGALADDGRAVEAQFDSGDRLDKPTFIILSGTQKDVEGLFRANPRLGAKFNQRIVFPDYTVDERVAMAVLMLEDEGLELSDAGTKCLGELLSGPSRQFLVNGTRVRRIIDAAVGRHWHRISRSRSADRNKDSLRVIEPIDFEGVEAELPVGLENARQLGFKATLVADEKELLFG